MNWLFWAIVIIGVLLLAAPLLGLVSLALRATVWIIGALLLVGAILWAISALSRTTTTTAGSGL